MSMYRILEDKSVTFATSFLSPKINSEKRKFETSLNLDVITLYCYKQYDVTALNSLQCKFALIDNQFSLKQNIRRLIINRYKKE